MRQENINKLKTEKEGIRILRDLESGFMVPSEEEKRFLFDILKIEYKKYFKSIDGVILNVSSVSKVISSKDFILVEIKTTSAKNVKELPYGVFFGLTKNEEDLFKKIDNYRLCIVHNKLKKHILLKFKEYESLIQNKRVQYQINFKSKKSIID